MEDPKHANLESLLSKYKELAKEKRDKLAKTLGFLHFSKLDQLIRRFGKKLTDAEINYTLEYNFSKQPMSVDGGAYELGEIFLTIYERDNPAMLFSANFMDGIFEILTGTYDDGDLGCWTWNKVQKTYELDNLDQGEIENVILDFLTQSLNL